MNQEVDIGQKPKSVTMNALSIETNDKATYQIQWMDSLENVIQLYIQQTVHDAEGKNDNIRTRPTP